MSLLDMRRTGERYYNVKSLNGKRSMIVRLHFLGMSNIDISRQLTMEGISCTPQNVSDIVNSPLSQRRLELMRQEADGLAVNKSVSINERIDQVLPKAMENIASAVETGVVGEKPVDVKEVLQLSKYLMQVRGYSPIQRIAGQVEHKHAVQGDILQKIKERSEEIKDQKLETVDADFIVLEEAVV